MIRRRRTAWSVSLALVTTTALCIADAPPNPPEAPAADLRAAGHNFAEGERAFAAHEFARAADAFEAADAIAPSDDAVWNAARARHRAGDLARAAALYARYLERTRPGARDRERAASILAQLSTRLARIEVQAPGAELVTVDDLALERPLVYVNPGSHVVRARHGGRDEKRTFAVDAGQSLTVAFVDEDRPVAPGKTLEPVVAPPAPDGARPRLSPLEATPVDAERPGPPSKRWSPWVFAVEAGVTAVAGGLTVASAIDTRLARDAYLRAPTEDGLTSGEAKEVRTNVAIGVTSGLAALTLATALWLVDFRGAPRAAAGLSGSWIAGRF